MPFGTGIFAHGFTYSGHPVSCAVALEALKIYRYTHFSILKTYIQGHFRCIGFNYFSQMFCKITGTRERDIPGHVAHVSQRFQKGIKAFAPGSPIVGEVFISMFIFSNTSKFLMVLMYHTSMDLFL